MLFRRRVSFQGAVNVRRRVYDEMVAYTAPTNAEHGAQRYVAYQIIEIVRC